MLKTRAGRVTVTVVGVLIILAVAIIVLINGGDRERTAEPTDTGSAQLVRDNSHRLTDPRDPQATFVEFLDFECEGCRAAFPIVEQLRAEYGDRLPVVLLDGREHSYFDVDEPRLRADLRR